MKANKTINYGNIYVSIDNDNTVLTIETIGEYDYIHRVEFKTEKEAKEYYDKF